jgi:hypothetical protein
MSIQYRKRVRGPRLGPLQTFLNIGLRGISATARLGRLAVNSRGRVSMRLARGLSWRIR